MAHGITCNYHTVPTHITHTKVNNDDTQRQQSIKTKSAPLRQSVLKGMMTMEVSLFLFTIIFIIVSL